MKGTAVPRMNVISALQQIQKDPRTASGKEVAPVAWEAVCLEEVCGACTMVINGRVRQACSALIDKLAPNLKLTAKSPDGIVEGVEWAGDDWWMLGVQWHPEELVEDSKPWDRGLFRALREQAARRLNR